VNKEQLKRSVYKHFRIQPAAQWYEPDGKLRGSIDDAWILMAATEKSFILRNRPSDHTIELGFDSYVGFTEDPGGKVSHGTDGILVLKAQLYMHNGVLKFAPTIAPGKELRDFTPPQTRKSFTGVLTARFDAQDLERRRAEFYAGPWGQEITRNFQELGDAIKAFIAEIRAAEPRAMIRFHRYKGGYLVFAQGWYVTFQLGGIGLPGDAYLSIIKWHGCPTLPGIIGGFTATPGGEQCYQYRLVRIDEAGWVDKRKPEVALTSRDVLERLFAELFENPSSDSELEWRLSED